ncbi:MAG TPA: hypothetical protein VLA34_01350 [Candidatus Krumholzibacterium sp.]|nr:hypothetical protein [Candidatus Krumholzibacterium sp.]
MKKIVIIALAFLIPASVAATPTLNFYFADHPGPKAIDIPGPMAELDAFIFGEGLDCYFTGCEFAVTYPAGVFPIEEEYFGNLSMGNTTGGLSLTFWPPLDGWTPGYNAMARVRLLFTGDCNTLGRDLRIEIGPHPISGELRGTCWPDNVLFDITGTTSILCPEAIANGSESWGVVKSLYK